ncbi:hypothetical protein BDR04DRAFT_1093627 [Suillus decipiens]|nr:hypothetical protein BDR04DRAFT_1093627 [Suillus decipiens]
MGDYSLSADCLKQMGWHVKNLKLNQTDIKYISSVRLAQIKRAISLVVGYVVTGGPWSDYSNCLACQWTLLIRRVGECVK